MVSKTAQEMKVGDIIEFTTGPFSGSQAKILSIDKTREILTVKSLVPQITIPIVIQVAKVKKVT